MLTRDPFASGAQPEGGDHSEKPSQDKDRVVGGTARAR
jgi:hypothetical protein